MYRAAKQIGPLPEITPRKPREYFASLCSEIINQQLASKAASAIEGRFVALFPRRVVTIKHTLSLTEKTLRNVGMSFAKARFIKDLAQKVTQKEVQLDKLQDSEDTTAIQELTKIKGIGPWTAEMFLIFTLGRPDIFSFGDLGLRRAIEKLYQLSDPSREELETITIKWSPYRSFASRILWKVVDG